MDAIDASTVIYVPPEEVYGFIQDFSGYTDYSAHLDSVRQYGDGGPGTDYRITVSWWKFSYTSETRVTEVDPPNRIDWRATKDVSARGAWLIDPVDPPDDREHATRLRLLIEFDPASVTGIRLPGFLSANTLFDKLKPIVVRESEKIVAAMVADLEGARRAVDLTVHRSPRSL
ncbi:type II toxin-antitoxin system RatA family toxin [Natronomonas sp. EA1]|uniref:type II toxin-antitoxin system RatA family toxin n=1 Tax=Natronomonas sp. EA1 TaxID=3421655 RepID=UPI003EBCFB74